MSTKKPRFDFPVYNTWKDTMPDPIVDTTTTPNTVYYGYSDYGVAGSSPSWMVWRETTVGGITTVEYAGGRKGLFEHIWDDRATLKYSR